MANEGTPITEMSYEELQALGPSVAGFVYPKRNISPFIPILQRGQRMALALYFTIAVAMIVAGLILPFVMKSWWWLVLVPGGILVWRANRNSMEQFFIQNLQANANFYEAIRRSKIGTMVKVVTREQRARGLPELHSYRDTAQQCFANVRLGDGSPCFISVAQTGVLVKASKTGISGPTLYDSESAENAAMTAAALSSLFPDSSLPDGMTNIVLRAFTNACLHGHDAAEVTRILNAAAHSTER